VSRPRIIPIALGFDTCYVLSGDGVIAIDAGQPNRCARFRRGLERAGIDPHDVQLILPTHGHWDHIGSARDMKSLTGAPVALHRNEVAWLEQGLTPLPPGVTPWGHVFIAVHRLFLPFIKVPTTTVDVVLGDEQISLADYGIPGTIVPTPGHSSGSISVVLEGGDAFVGDLAMNKFPLTLSPSLPIFAEDIHVVVRSWRTLLGLGVKTIFPAHGPPFPADVMRRAIERL
jgi:glyoxylase-like metal-dependent hydrolase (beta-lactamase superfamily II)